jgi:chemotaxis protein methyltransferase CheR
MVVDISVGVSDFFRHPAQFKLIREVLLPYLESFPVIKCWSAGCATGEEAYSLAILLDELGLLKRSRLFATDFNSYLINLAKNGLFPLKSLQPGQTNYQQSGGQHHFDASITQGSRYFGIKDHLRNATLFHRHSLVDEGIFNEFQLILCRNVMIYFMPELQSKLLARFAQSLHHDGFLVLGPQDGIDHLARKAGFIPYIKGSHIYRVGDHASNGELNE